MRNNKKSSLTVCLTLIAALLSGIVSHAAPAAMPAASVLVSYGPGASEPKTPGLANYSAPAAYGPVTAAGPGVSAGQGAAGHLLMTDDQFPLYTDDSFDLGGASLILVRGIKDEHQLCMIIETSDGHRIVVDGGRDTGTDYLYRYLCENGGFVDAWLVTHPHHDHAGALMSILADRDRYPLDIRNIYFSPAPIEFYRAYEEAGRLPFTETLFAAVSMYDQSRVHIGVPCGTVITVGNVSIKVLNEPYQIISDAGNNSSVCYMITVNGKNILVLGDLGVEASRHLIGDIGADSLRADIVQLAHHGQYGGSPELYSAVSPRAALWSCSSSAWRSRLFSYSKNSTYTAADTYNYLKSIGTIKQFSMSDGNWRLR